MKKGIVLLILLLLGIILFVFTLKQVGLTAIAKALAPLSLGEILLILIVTFVSLVVMGALKWSVVLGKTEEKNLFWTLFIGKWVGFSISHVTPAALLGGEPARFLIVKNDTKNIESSRIVSSIILEKLSLFLTFIISFFIGAFFILIYLHLAWLAQAIGFLIIFIVAIIAWKLFRKIKDISHDGGFFHFMVKKFRLHKFGLIKKNLAQMDEVENNMREFFHYKDRVLKLFLLTILEVTIVFFSYWLIMYFSGINLSIPKLFAVRTMIDASYNLTPVPAGLGVLELIQAYGFKAIGLTFANGVAFSLIFRGMNLFIALTGIAIFAWMQLKYWGKQILDKIEQFIIKYTNGKNNH